MKTLLTLTWAFLCTLLVQSQPLRIPLQTSHKGPYDIQVHQTDMGGGGYITGIVQDYTRPERLFARSDVAGVFCSEDGGRSWRPQNAGLDKMSDHYCHSLAIDPFDPQSLLRASGDVRNFHFTGRIHRSTDGGKNWRLVKDGLDYYGNGGTRYIGELICYNPDKAGEVAAGTYSKGIWISHDSGETWKKSGLDGERIASVLYHRDRIYVGTIPDAALFGEGTTTEELQEKLRELQDFPRKRPGRLYTSDDGGQHWRILFEHETLAVYEIVVADGGQTILFSSQKGVYRSTNGGATFQVVASLPTSSKYRTLTQSPRDPRILYTAEQFPTQYPITIYKSEDTGATWSPLSPDCKPEQLFEFPEPWHGQRPGMIGSAISHILPDCLDPDKLYIANWWGVTTTYDGGRSYYGHQFRGIGILCCETLVKHPVKENCWACGVCDHAPALSFDAGQSYAMAPVSSGPGRVLTFSRHDPDLLMYAAERKGEYMRLIRSTDLGKTGQIVWELKGKNFVQDLKEDPHVKGRFWAYLEGDLTPTDSAGLPAGLYCSNDYGKHWQPTNAPSWGAAKSLPVQEFLIDKDLTPIVNYQHKNGCGTGQMLAFDAKQKDVIYMGEWTKGIFISHDAGHSWVNVGKRLPFHSKSYAVLSCLYADPNRSGIIYAGFWNKGLWKSEDFGQSWKQVRPQGIKSYNANSISISRTPDGRNLFAVACSNHPLGDHPIHLFISTDEGTHWTDIYDNSLGCLRWIQVVTDITHQSIHAATAGSGIFYFTLKQ